MIYHHVKGDKKKKIKKPMEKLEIEERNEEYILIGRDFSEEREKRKLIGEKEDQRTKK